MYCELRIRNISTTVKADRKVDDLLFGKLSLFDNKAVYSAAYRNHVWDGRIRFYSRSSHSFDTGLLSWVIRLLNDNNVKVKCIDCREKPKMVTSREIVLPITLRDYQKEIVEQCMRCGRGIVSASVAAGKTEIFIALIAALRVRTVVIVDDLTLGTQTMERILACGVPVRKFGGGKIVEAPVHGEDPWVTVSTYQTLRNRKELLRTMPFDMKIADECHGVAANTWHDVMSRIPAYYSFGFSGTIDWRMEEQIRYARIMAMTGKQIVHVPSSLLVDQGVLARPKIYMVQFDCPVKVGTFPEEYEHAIIRNENLNQVIIPKIMEKHKDDKVLILVNRIEHGNILARRLKIDFIHGSNLAETRDHFLKMFQKGEIKKLIASKIFKQGVNIPDVEVILSVGSDDSYKAVYQKLGRGMRKTDTKHELIYYDIYPASGGYLEKHAKNRLRKYEYANFDVKLLPENEL